MTAEGDRTGTGYPSIVKRLRIALGMSGLLLAAADLFIILFFCHIVR